MTLILYRNASVPNKVVKNLTQVAQIAGNLRQGTSVLSPVFTIVGEHANVSYNYFKVTEWNRYYFTGSAKFEINGTMTLSGVIDPLMSFSDDIKKARAIIKRQEFIYNLYLDDERLMMNQNPKHKIVKFPNGFNDFSYILALAGNGQIGT